MLRRSQPPTLTLAVAAERWRNSRVDVATGTLETYRVAINRLRSRLGDVAVNAIDAARVAELVAELQEAGLKKHTVRKTVSVLAIVLDHAGVRDNPALAVGSATLAPLLATFVHVCVEGLTVRVRRRPDTPGPQRDFGEPRSGCLASSVRPRSAVSHVGRPAFSGRCRIERGRKSGHFG